MSLTTMNDIAYDTWEPGLNDIMEREEGFIYPWLYKTNKDVFGRTTKIKFQDGTSTGIHMLEESEEFPDAGDPSHLEGSINLKRFGATTEFTLDEVELLDGKDAAAESVVEHKLDDLIAELRRDVERQLWGDGTGILARATASVSSNVLDLQKVTNSASAVQYDRDLDIWLEEGRYLVDIVHGTTGVKAHEGLAIVDYDPDAATPTIEFDSAPSSATTNHVIVRSGNTTASGGAIVYKEMEGIQKAVATDNTYLGLDRTAAGYRRFKAQVITGDTAGVLQPITHDRVLRLINKVTKRKGLKPLKKDYFFISNLGVWSAYGEYLQSGVRYQAMETLDFGWPTLQIFGTKFHADIHAPHNQLYLLKRDAFEIRRPKYKRRPLFRFMNDDGSMWRYKRGTNNIKPVIQSNLTGMMQLVTEAPYVHGMLDDIEEAG